MNCDLPGWVEELQTNYDNLKHAYQGVVAKVLILDSERDTLNSNIAYFEDLLKQIGDYAHDNSTGPSVPDAFWEIRRMAYEGFTS